MRSFVLKHALRVLTVGLALAGSASLCAENAPPILPDFVPVSWLSVMAPALAKASIASETIALAPVGAEIKKEDRVTLLVQSIEGKTLRQWAVALIINPRGPEEKKYMSPAQTLYLSTGNKIEFPARLREGMAIHVLGPFSQAKGSAKAKDVWSGALINTQYLGIGLDAVPALILRMQHRAAHDPSCKGKIFSIQTGSAAFPPEQIATNRAMMEPFAITAAEEHSFAGGPPALMDFFNIAALTPGVNDILYEAVDIPWLKLVTHGGQFQVNFEFMAPFEKLSASDWGLPPDAHVYAMGLRISLFGKPALLCRLALTTPRVPLLNCAGIVGLAAMRPDGKGPHLMIRVMAANAAPSPPVP